MRVRLLAAVAAVCLFAGLAPAQWSVADAGGPAFYPGNGPRQVGDFVPVATYPTGFAVGHRYVAGAMVPVVRRPDATFVELPAGFQPFACSAAGSWAGGRVRAGGVDHPARLRVADGRVDLLAPAAAGYTSLDVTAVGEDGVCATSGQKADWWLYGGVWRPDGSHITVPASRGHLAPEWSLYSCWSVEPNGDGTYTARGVGSKNGAANGNYVLTGPLP